MPQTNNTQEIDNRSLLEKLMDENPLIKSGIKKIQKNQDEHIDQAMQSGMPAKDILQGLIEQHEPQFIQPKRAMQQPSITPEGDVQKAGWLQALIGTSTQTMLNQQKQLSEMKQGDLSSRRLNLSEERLSLEKEMEERRIKTEKRRIIQDTKNTIYNSGAELTEEDLQDPEIAKIVMPLIKQNNIEPIIDPDSGITIYSIPPKGILEKVRKEVAAINLKKKELSKELSDYFAVGDSLPTADGLGRFAQGANLYAGSKFQTDTQGALAAQLAGLNKRLRVKLVRAAGDVGNLNIVEQEAAERLLYNFSDSTNLRTLKRAFLMDLTKAVDDDKPMEIKTIINRWIKKENPTTFNTPSQTQQGWTQEKESRYQELLKNRGK